MPPADTPTHDIHDRLAMERLVRGDEEALRELAERYGPRVVRFLYRLVGDAHDAVDLCQETLLRVYRHRAEYDPSRPFRIWLFTIAANLGRNVLRARRRFLRISLQESAHGPDSPTIEDILIADAPSPDVSAERGEIRKAVRHAIERLSPDLRTTVELVDLHDWTTREAAVALRVPERTIESRLYHGRRKLRQFLARWVRRMVSSAPLLSGA